MFQQCGYCSMISSNTPQTKQPTHNKILSSTLNGSLASLKKKKLLPHIQEEYSFRITNRILVYKIMNPKRDKTITDSLLHTTLNQSLNNQSQMSWFSSQSRKNIGTKKHYPTQRQVIQAENKCAVFAENNSQLNTQNEKGCDYSCLNDKTNINREIINNDRKQVTNTTRERIAGKILRNNYISACTVQSITPLNNHMSESGFIARQTVNENVDKRGDSVNKRESEDKRGRLRRNPILKLKCSIEQAH